MGFMFFDPFDCEKLCFCVILKFRKCLIIAEFFKNHQFADYFEIWRQIAQLGNIVY